jgi:polysaccharide export outer membrane protein
MRPRGRSIALLFALVTAVLPGTAAAQTSAVGGEYRIGPEDVLDISVWKNTELTQTVQVRPDGKISLPLVNDVQAAGLTPMELRGALAKGYATYFNQPEISIGVKEVRSIKVSVLGMVKTSGRYDLKSRATVLDALALAGGFSEFAKRDRIFVSRRDATGVKRLRFDYLKVLDGDDDENFQLLPGDIIIVP